MSDPRISAGLRQFRAELGLTGDHVAAQLHWSASKVSRLELGRTSITLRALAEALDFYQAQGLDPGKTRSLRALAEISASRPGPGSYADGTELAESVSEWAPLIVPRLLQVPGYTRAVLASRQDVLMTPPGEMREAAAAVLRSQDRLAGRPPLQLRAVLDESVLYRQAGSPGVMRAQLHHLEQAGRVPGTDTEIRVLPSERGVLAWAGPFAYLEYPDWEEVSAPAAVLADDLEGPRILDLPEQATWRRYLAFRQLWEAAAPAGPLIRRALADARPGTPG